MEYTKETPRREITIATTVLKVICPFKEGDVLNAEQANVLNQTLAENLRNNFAPRVKQAKEEAEKNGTTVDVNALQKELNEYTKEYTFGARRTAGVAVDPVTKIALSLAKDALRKAFVKNGKNVKDYTAEQFTTLAERALQTNPKFMELAQEEYARRQARAQETFDLNLEA